MKKVQIFDTTLRDGTQGMGVSFSTPAKLSFVRRMDALGVDFVEGGYAGSSQRDMELFDQARKHLHLKHTKLVAFGSTRKAGVKVAEDNNVACLLRAGTEVVCIFGKSWRLHVTDVLKTTLDEDIAMIRDTVAYLKKQGRRVIYDAEHFFDGYKDSPSFAMDTLKAAVEAGAEAVVLCDTNGGCMPHEIYEITSEVVKAFPVTVGIHCHNDTGSAVSNSVEAVRAGATQVQGTMNGYGERCGNANLCVVVPTLELKLGKTCLRPGALKELRSVSVFVDDLANLRHDERAPYVGRNAFSHKAGMHVNAVEKNPKTFEHIQPESVGNERTVLLSEASGRSSVLLKAIELGVGSLDKSSPEVQEVLASLKDMESKGYAFEAADASFKLLVQKVLKKHRPFFDLEGFRVIVEKRGKNEPCMSEATVKMRVNNEQESTVAEAGGPVDALNAALRKALTKFYPLINEVSLTDFRVRILDPEEATAAKTRVLIESSDGKSTWGTVGVSQNIIEASWEALVDSVEFKLFKDEECKVSRKSGPAKTRVKARGKRHVK